jgi:tetratricopeptide (TPR) repeat protein
MSIQSRVIAEIEKMTIPTYCPPEPFEMPMYSEFRQHQGSTGYAYPNRVTQGVERRKLTDVEYDVVRLENEYIRIIILPALGGRILEGYDKKNDYHFLYRHSRIKPVLVGNYGSWISGGMEWNYPFHHRPSTFLPVDYTLETLEDGTVICWLSEASISPGQYRIKGMVGVTLRPDASYFETKVQLANRTEMEHPFMWWENAGIHVNDDYQLFFPQDVRYVHHHYDRHHATFPIHKGWYAVENHPEPHDISIHKNTIKGNSYFAGPSKYDFFGGYDHRMQCGIIHIGNHHISPGKKMFQWALEDLGDAWNANLTDLDGEHAELMAGSFADDQPDFSWLAPFETKCFSQYWYPIHRIGTPQFATIHGAVAIDRERRKVRLITTQVQQDATLLVKCGERIVLRKEVSIAPAQCEEFDADLNAQKFHVSFTAADGTVLLAYTEDIPDVIRIPKDNPGLATPHELTTAQEITIAGRHVEQYRDPLWKKEEYYKVALERDPDYIPALIGMAGVCYESALYQEGLRYLKRAEAVQNAYSSNPSDGTISYLKGLCWFALHKPDEAYDAFYKSTWSHNVISYAMTFISAIDGQRGDFDKMKEHAERATKREADHPIAGSYAAIACWRLGNTQSAIERLENILRRDKLDHLARYLHAVISGSSLEHFFSAMNSNPSQTCLDVAFDLVNAGQVDEAIALLEGLKHHRDASTMALYTLAYLQEAAGASEKAAENRRTASGICIVDTFPYRQVEIEVLRAALNADQQDANAANLLGCILYDKKQHQRAAEAWEAAIAADSGYYMPYRNLAIAKYSYLGQRKQALPLLRKALELKPKDDLLVKEINYVMAKLGVNAQERLNFILINRPDEPSDHLTWELADAYSNTLNFDKALETLANHEFVAAECCEIYLTEAYTFACTAKGRLALRDGELKEALEWFRKGQKIPANFRAGWWDTQALYYARYFEALTLMRMGRTSEAKAIVDIIVNFIRSEYSPYIPPEVDYYIASAYRLVGDEITAVKHMSQKVVEWEVQLERDEDRKMIVTAVYIPYVDDAARLHKGAIQNALAYSRLFFHDEEGAREGFKKSLELAPDNIKAVFELQLINARLGLELLHT